MRHKKIREIYFFRLHQIGYAGEKRELIVSKQKLHRLDAEFCRMISFNKLTPQKLINEIFEQILVRLTMLESFLQFLLYKR